MIVFWSIECSCFWFLLLSYKHVLWYSKSYDGMWNRDWYSQQYHYMGGGCHYFHGHCRALVYRFGSVYWHLMRENGVYSVNEIHASTSTMWTQRVHHRYETVGNILRISFLSTPPIHMRNYRVCFWWYLIRYRYHRQSRPSPLSPFLLLFVISRYFLFIFFLYLFFFVFAINVTVNVVKVFFLCVPHLMTVRIKYCIVQTNTIVVSKWFRLLYDARIIIVVTFVPGRGWIDRGQGWWIRL